MKSPFKSLTPWPLLGFAAFVTLGGLSCVSSDAPISGTGGAGTGGKSGGTGGSTSAGSGGSTSAGSGGSTSAGSGGSTSAGSGGSTSAGSGGSTSAGSGGSTSAGSGGSTSAGSGGSTSAGSGGSGPTQSCADPTAKGSLDVANVGTAPGAITQADLAGASPATHYYASIPGNLPPAGTTDPAKQVGLFLVFHEHGSNPGVEMPSVTKSLANLKRSGDFIVLGLPIDPNTTTHPYTTADHMRAKLLLDYALKTWPINPRRVYLWGRGEGATMSHQWGTENKASVAAMITYSWGWDNRNWPSNAANDEPDLYLVIGLSDYPTTHVPLVRRVYTYAKAAGFKILYREVPGLNGPTANAPTNDDAVAWAINSRHKTQALSTQETALLAPYQDAGAAAGICPDASLFAGIELVGGLAAGKVMPGVLKAGTEASRVLATQIAGRANFGDTADMELGAKLKDSSAAVRKAAITSLGVTANWRTPSSQKALIDFVGNSAGDATERGLAVDAIGVALKFQIGGAVDTGAYQDPPLFQALITLLSDSDQTLRSKAFTILKPAMPSSSYNPATAPASQQSAIQAWSDWFKTLKG